MKILYVSESKVPSHTANSVHVMKICAAFARLGHDVNLISRYDSRDVVAGVDDPYAFYDVENNFSIQFIPSGRESKSLLDKCLKWYLESFSLYKDKPLYCWKLKKYLHSITPDFVITRSLVSCRTTIESGFQTFFERHQPLKRAAARDELCRLSRKTNFVKFIAITEALKHEYSSIGLSQEKIAILPDGADVADYDYSKPPTSVDEHLNIGYVGSLYKGKGIEIIEKILNALPADTFHIVGGNERDLKYWKNRLKSKNIKFYGFIPQYDLKTYYKFFDICILPNQKTVFGHRVSGEGDNIGDYTSPLKLFEYMSYKKPIIASDLPVLREILNENNSLLVPHDDPTEWVNAINSLRDVQLRKKIARQGHEDFIGNYTWQKRAENIIGLYSDNIK